MLDINVDLETKEALEQAGRLYNDGMYSKAEIMNLAYFMLDNNSDILTYLKYLKVIPEDEKVEIRPDNIPS